MIGISENHIPEFIGTFRHCMKKPVVVEAIQMQDDFFVETRHGRMSGLKGDYLMRGIEGELYVCSKMVFEATYDFFGGQGE